VCGCVGVWVCGCVGVWVCAFGRRVSYTQTTITYTPTHRGGLLGDVHAVVIEDALGEAIR